MISEEQAVALATAHFPDAKIHSQQSGRAIWLDIIVRERSFTVQITPEEGVGVSERNDGSDSQPYAHDEACPALDKALGYIRKKLEVPGQGQGAVYRS